MHFTSALAAALLATSAAALPPTRVGVTSNAPSVNSTSELHARNLNFTGAPILPRAINSTSFILPRDVNATNFAGSRPNLHVPRSWNLTAEEEKKALFPRLSLNKNSTEGVFDKRDVPVEAVPTGIVKRASPTGYVKRSFGTGTPFQA
ncbi:uncharacterized protein LTHEOB_1985 [Neofusicoccum parvum]|uniref:Uncharacterized protein n=3 Tax=Neofusicoccum TaxID=407951 RepID=R1GCL3_BOTPV|nr:hypothetical protein UCRNP2_7303 [Neofusicoccum parvum UCRNP2]GME32922.1 uncharacterized protein LTHEOB_1985 [Neofusicoccum parvum]GME39816.1 uncharacterized protein LTHEOB_1985 [Neofusicoccum parvum]